MTGTDIYPQPEPAALETMRLADRLIGLQPAVGDQIPEEFHCKLRVIIQASPAVAIPPAKTLDPFEVCVVGHMRAVKDPMLCAQASRLLPARSKIRVRHAGAILDPEFAPLVAQEARENPRYIGSGSSMRRLSGN